MVIEITELLMIKVILSILAYGGGKAIIFKYVCVCVYMSVSTYIQFNWIKKN